MFNSRSKTNYKTQKQVFLVLLAHMAKESELVRNVTNYAGKNSRMITITKIIHTRSIDYTI